MSRAQRAEPAEVAPTPHRVLDAPGIQKVLTRLAHELGERHPEDLDRVVIAGIREGGLAVARRLAAHVRAVWARDVPVVALDVSGFRDDRPRQPGLRGSWQPVPPGVLAPSPEGMVVVLVDDVIQTGRTMRAALDLVSSRGRPAAIEMAVLVDRGGREVPLRPTHVGRNLPVAAGDWVEIRLAPEAAEPGIYLVPRP
jgi:pyrimidine operon attenuation protein/uracil phosphoribosyltransferase